MNDRVFKNVLTVCVIILATQFGSRAVHSEVRSPNLKLQPNFIVNTGELRPALAGKRSAPKATVGKIDATSHVEIHDVTGSVISRESDKIEGLYSHSHQLNAVRDYNDLLLGFDPDVYSFTERRKIEDLYLPSYLSNGLMYNYDLSTAHGSGEPVDDISGDREVHHAHRREGDCVHSQASSDAGDCPNQK
jgi:hypothetical protein